MPAIVKTDTYRANGVGQDVSANLAIGGNMAQAGKFVPNLNVSFKCGSSQEIYYININRPGAVVTNESEVHSDQDVRIRVGDTTDAFSVIDEESKWDVIYDTDPRGNPQVGDYVETFLLQSSPTLGFYKQPALDINGDPVPEKVQGSYAVYCDRKGNYSDVQFYTGKLCHIYRPWIVDANGDGVWGDIDISGGTIAVTIPQEFLDVAVFPVTLDPNLGYTTIGGTKPSPGSGTFHAFHDTTDGTGGNTSEIKIYVHAHSGSTNIKMAVYDSSGNSPINRLATAVIVDITGGASATWFSGAYVAAVAASTKYWMAWILETSGPTFAYDIGAANSHYVKSGIGSFDLSDPAPVGGNNNTVRYSIYAVYAAGVPSLIVQNVSQAQSIDEVAITQHGVLAVNDVSQGQSADNVVVTIPGVLIVQDAGQVQTIDSVVLLQHNVLVVAAIDQSQSIDPVSITQHNVLAIDDVNQDQAIENVVLSVISTLVVDGVSQDQNIDSVALTQHNILVVDDVSQLQNIDPVVLAQHNVLVVNDVSQLQKIQNINVGDGVYGKIGGTIVLISPIGGASVITLPVGGTSIVGEPSGGSVLIN